MNDNIKNALWILYNSDRRVSVHSFYQKKDDDVFRHDDGRCPRCLIEKYLGLSTG